MDRPTKIILVISAFIGIAAIQAAISSRFELPAKRIICGVTFVLFASLILFYAIYAVLAGEVGVKNPTGGKVISREKDPGGFWLFVGAYAAIGLWMFYLIVSADYHLFEKQAQNDKAESSTTPQPAHVQISK